MIFNCSSGYSDQRTARFRITCWALRIVVSEQYSNLPWKFMPPVKRLGHGKFEYCSLTTMRKAQQVILNLTSLWAN